jgi:hypothetical protein
MRGGGVAEIRKLPAIANGNSFVVVLLIPIDEAVRFDVVIIFALNVLNEGNRIELNIKVETC